MKKSILFGSIFVLTLILLMPSIPAVQFNTIKERVNYDLLELDKDLENQQLDELKDLIKSYRNDNDIGVLTPGLGLILMIIAFLVFIMDNIRVVIDLIMEGELVKTIFMIVTSVIGMFIMNIIFTIILFISNLLNPNIKLIRTVE